MTAFRCIAIPTETASRFRATLQDDYGNPVRRMPAGERSPCRHCLRYAAPGEPVLLGSYKLPRPQGIYWTPSPVFVHEAACPRFDAPGTIAPTVLEGQLISIRAYDGEDQCLYELGHAGPGEGCAPALHHALADLRTAFINVHTAKPGCWLARVEKIGPG